MAGEYTPDNQEELKLDDELRKFTEDLQKSDPKLYERFKDVLSSGARYLEEGLHTAETNSERSGQYTTQSRSARDKAEMVVRLIKSDANRATSARERAEKALEDAEKGSAAVTALAEAHASANAGAPGFGGGGPSFETSEPRPADPLVATMGQLSTLLIGSSPAFANAIRMQTDAVASGMGNLNAIANQQSHYTLDLAATARAVAEAYSANKKPDMHFHITVADPPPPPPPPAPKK